MLDVRKRLSHMCTGDLRQVGHDTWGSLRWVVLRSVLQHRTAWGTRCHILTQRKVRLTTKMSHEWSKKNSVALRRTVKPMHGGGRKALKLFSKMKEDVFSPDQVTFVGVLCACTHEGLVDEGIDYFYAMERGYGVVPEIEHYGCMIDLLGRGGRLSEALRLVQSMPFEPNAKIWGALLGACRLHNAVGLAKEVLNNLVKLEPIDSGNFNMLSNICASAGDWNSVANVRLRMKNKRVQKPSGASSIELNGDSHDFSAMDTLHPQSDGIYDMIDQLSQHKKQQVYAPIMFLGNDMA